MSIIVFLIVGLIAGFLARAIMPGRQHMGILGTLVLGLVGSFIGGFLAHLIGRADYDRFHPAGLIGSIIGALIVLAITMAVRNRGGGVHAFRH